MSSTPVSRYSRAPALTWLVLAAGLLILGVCIYRLWSNQPYDYDAQVKAAAIFAPAPLFEGVDEHNQIFRLSTYLGRHRIIVVFYDGAAGADHSAAILELRNRADELARQNVKTVAISQAIPQVNRATLKELGELSFPLISDVDGAVHQKWGRMSADGQPLTGVFLINRKGDVPFQSGVPRPYTDLDELWKELRG